MDFEALGPGLIAIVGENGAGKSTLIGSVFAALFRQLPGQKRSLYDFCTHPKPEIDLTFGVNGERCRSLLKLDPKARQMDSYIFDSQGVALVSGKREAFAEWMAKHVGSPGGFLASIFSSQRRSGNFLSLERSQRRGFCLRRAKYLLQGSAAHYFPDLGQEFIELDLTAFGGLHLFVFAEELKRRADAGKYQIGATNSFARKPFHPITNAVRQFAQNVFPAASSRILRPWPIYEVNACR